MFRQSVPNPNEQKKIHTSYHPFVDIRRSLLFHPLGMEYLEPDKHIREGNQLNEVPKKSAQRFHDIPNDNGQYRNLLPHQVSQGHSEYVIVRHLVDNVRRVDFHRHNLQDKSRLPLPNIHFDISNDNDLHIADVHSPLPVLPGGRIDARPAL